MKIERPTFDELCQALSHTGLSFVRMTRSPMRIDGMWRCEVLIGSE